MLNYTKEKETSEIAEREKIHSELQKREQKVVQFSSIVGFMQLFSVFAISIVFVGIVEIIGCFSVNSRFYETICRNFCKYALKFAFRNFQCKCEFTCNMAAEKEITN